MFEVTRSGYFAWAAREPSDRQQANQVLDQKIVSIFDAHKHRYGVRRIHDELKDQGENCGKHRVFRRMRCLGLQAKAKKKYKVTTDSKHHLPVAENLLARDFTATGINQKWVGDITYIHTEEGWLYVATVVDLHSRAVIGWSMQSTMTAELISDALLMALWRRGFPKGVIFHSDRGSQYCSVKYQKLLKTYRFICSMSRKGNCWDNAVAESFFHTLKTELVYSEKYLTREAAKQSIFQYIECYYNRVRRHSSNGSMAPLVFENQMRKLG